MNGEIVACIEDHAELAQTLGHIGDAVRLYAAVEAFRERIQLPRPARRSEPWRNAIAAARSALGDAAFDAAWSEGNAWEMEQATRNALAPVAPPGYRLISAAAEPQMQRPPPGHPAAGACDPSGVQAAAFFLRRRASQPPPSAPRIRLTVPGSGMVCECEAVAIGTVRAVSISDSIAGSGRGGT